MIDLPLYHVTLTRDALNDLMSALSVNDRIDVCANDNGEISFNLPPECGVSIKQVNIAEDLMAEGERLDKKQKTLKENGKRWNELEERKMICMHTALEVTKILKKCYDDAKIE